MYAPASCEASGNPDKRPPALFVSKFFQRWHEIILDKFSGHYDLSVSYFIGGNSQGYSQFIKDINAIISEKKISVVFLDMEFLFGFGLDMALAISRNAKTVLVTFDDISMHEVNYINSLGCDLVTCADPIAVLKYREQTVKAELLFLENSRKPYEEFRGIPKDIDVLFFGDLNKGNRAAFIAELSAKGIAVTVHSPSQNGELSYSELAHLISRAKIVVNLSKTHSTMHCVETFLPISHFLQFKGRVIEAGLGGAVCVSEYAPSIEILFGQAMVPTFSSADECANIINELLNNPDRLQDLALQLQDTIFAHYEQEEQTKHLVAAIQSLEKVDIQPPSWLPARYVTTVAIARFLSLKRPLRVWVEDLIDFMGNGNVYPLRLRILAAAALIAEGSKRLVGKLCRILRRVKET